MFFARHERQSSDSAASYGGLSRSREGRRVYLLPLYRSAPPRRVTHAWMRLGRAAASEEVSCGLVAAHTMGIASSAPRPRVMGRVMGGALVLQAEGACAAGPASPERQAGSRGCWCESLTHVATITCLLTHGRVLYVAKIAPTSWLPPPALYLIKPLICQCRAALSRPVAWRQPRARATCPRPCKTLPILYM